MTLALSQPKMRTVTTIKQENRKKELQKQLLKFSLFLAAAIAAVFAMYAFAEAPTRIDENGNHMMLTIGGKSYDLYELNNGINALVFEFSCWVYGGLPHLISNADFIRIDTSADYFQIFTGICESMIPIGIGFGTIWALLDLLEKAQMDQMSPEVLIRWGIKLMIMVTLINNTTDIATWCVNAGNELMDRTLDATTAPNGILDQLYDTLKTSGWLKGLSMIIELIVPALTNLVCFIVMLVQIYSRLLECGVRYAFMPLGISDAFTHGVNSPGIRYIKKFFAVCIQGAVLMMILMAGLALQESNGSAAIGGVSIPLFGLSSIMDFVITITMVGAMLKSQQLVNDIAGV